MIGEDKYSVDFETLVRQELELRSDIADLQQTNDDRSIADYQKLITNIKNDLSSLHDRIKETKLKAEEDDNTKTSARVMERVKGHQKEYENLKYSLRTATFKMKSNLDKRHERDRSLLLEGNAEVRNRIMAQTRLDAIKQSSMLTDELRKSRSVLNDQLERSLLALQEIDVTNRSIDKNIQQHRKYTTVVKTGKRYLTKLKRREFTDRMLILFSLVVFLLVVLCIHLFFIYFIYFYAS